MVNIYLAKDESEIPEAMRLMLLDQRGPDGHPPSLSAWTVEVWKDSLVKAGLWPIKKEDKG
jgi:hypothetical protein